METNYFADNLETLLSLKRKQRDVVENSQKRRKLLNLPLKSSETNNDENNKRNQNQIQNQNQNQANQQQSNQNALRDENRLRVKKVVAQTLLSKDVHLPIDSEALTRLVIESFPDFEFNSTDWTSIEPVLEEFDQLSIISIEHIALVRSTKCVVLDIQVSKLVPELYAINKKIGGGFSFHLLDELESSKIPKPEKQGIPFDGKIAIETCVWRNAY